MHGRRQKLRRERGGKIDRERQKAVKAFEAFVEATRCEGYHKASRSHFETELELLSNAEAEESSKATATFPATLQANLRSIRERLTIVRRQIKAKRASLKTTARATRRAVSAYRKHCPHRQMRPQTHAWRTKVKVKVKLESALASARPLMTSWGLRRRRALLRSSLQAHPASLGPTHGESENGSTVVSPPIDVMWETPKNGS